MFCAIFIFQTRSSTCVEKKLKLYEGIIIVWNHDPCDVLRKASQGYFFDEKRKRYCTHLETLKPA